ncbi:MAG: YitT family protein [Lachnospiraceae bacterium]|nr:YitT family protein [Lachnospiraceae bacterium]
MNKGIAAARNKVVDSPVFKDFLCVLGGFIYSFGANIFVRPLGLYNGGVIGYSQLITHFIEKAMGRTTNLYALLYIALNIPLFVLAYKGVNRRFFLRTLLGTGSIALFGYLLPTLATPILDNILTCSIVGGIFTGSGTGLLLLAGGCGGGIDILGVWMAQKKPDVSVGKVSIAVNLTLYIFLLFLFNVEIVIYTVIVAIVSALAVDRIHYQNITAEIMIFTKKKGMDKALIRGVRRGVTEWVGAGAYTDEETHILVSCVNKYEEHDFIERIHEFDPKAFIIINENVRVRGNFEKRM